MKVAHYEVLGWRSEKAPRPGWDDRRIQTLVKSHARDQEPNASIVPYRDGHLFVQHFPALRTGLLSLVPGPVLFAYSSLLCRVHARPRGARKRPTEHDLLSPVFSLLYPVEHAPGRYLSLG
jgi:hypothetical protein